MKDDLISRQAAIEAIDGALLDGLSEGTAIEILSELPSAQPEIRYYGQFEIKDPILISEWHWIPCSERLPEEDKDVLVTVYFKGLVQKHKTGWNDHIKPKSYVEVASQIDGEWHSYSDEYKVARDRHVVTAWMPLPEPYKEEER